MPGIRLHGGWPSSFVVRPVSIAELAQVRTSTYLVLSGSGGGCPRDAMVVGPIAQRLRVLRLDDNALGEDAALSLCKLLLHAAHLQAS